MMISTSKGKSELFLASSLCDGLEDSNLKQVTTLLKKKDADPNVLLPSFGISPFHLVIGNESEKFAEEVTKLFLRHGGNPNVRAVDGMTPVHVAAAWGRVKVLELLLANGGDPVCLDDDGRTPFHYAFDGAYYDAITVLGKYCKKNEDDDEDENEEIKVQMKLEKILVNKGNIIAEYVTSDMEQLDKTLIDNNENINIKLNNSFNTENKSPDHKSSPTSVEENARLSDENINIKSDHITLRRPWIKSRNTKAISPILSLEELDINAANRNEGDEKLLVGRIISRLSDSFHKINKPNNMMKPNNTKDSAKKFSSRIPQSKIYKNNLKSMETKTQILDSSIVSKSPNLHIPLSKSKTGTTMSLNSNLFDQNNVKLKNIKCTPSKSHHTKINSASSTPRRRMLERQYQSGSAENPGFKDNIICNQLKSSLNQTYSESDYDIPYSPRTEQKYKVINRRVLSKKVVRKLDDSMNDDDYGINVNINSNEKVVKRTPILNEISTGTFDTKTILGINRLKTNKNPINKDSNTRAKKNIEDKKEKLEAKDLGSVKKEHFKCYFESPGSSIPTSVNSSLSTNGGTEEENKFLDELYEICQAKGQTPPASVSKLTDDLFASDDDMEALSKNKGEYFPDFGGSIKQNSQVHGNDYTRMEFATSSHTESEIYKTPMRSTMSSNDSFLSVDEEYAYVDPEKNVAFLERRLRVILNIDDMDRVKNESTWIDRLAELSINSAISTQSSRLGSQAIGNNTLRTKLISLGEAPGPITRTTYNVYLKQLRKLENKVNLNKEIDIKQPQSDFTRVSNIPKNILTTNWISDIQNYQDLEDQMFKEYEKPNPTKKYRGGIGTTSFNYLLLDPRITDNLPRTGRHLHQNDRWKIFLEAIFYVGKGKANRPKSHLYDAFDIWTGKKQVDELSEKIQRIIDIWREGKGVVCLHVFMNTMQEEAFTREAAMIDALGTVHLSNCKKGDYYGILSTMNNEEKRSLGKYLLYKAMEIFMYEGERQIFPRSIS